MQEELAERLAQRALNLNLLTQRQLESVWAECGTRNVTATDFGDLLLRKELLTNYQVDRLMRGERSGFFYGRYKVLYCVGVGTFARVYRAVSTDDPSHVVAVKVLRNRFSDERNDDARKAMDQFLREGELGKSLRHPNIVPIHEVHSQSKPYFLVMDFVEGRTLREFVKVRHRLAPREATRLMADIVAALAYAAQKGINHRDLKLSNVLISSSGRAQLVDFGLAAETASMDENELNNCPNPRTIDYAGLERATGVRKDDARSDIYFAGCMFYHMLCGRAPLQETKDRIQRLSKTRYESVPPVNSVCKEIPQRVVSIVKKSMELDPAKRYQTPTDMLADLHATAKWLESGAPEDGEADLPMPSEVAAQPKHTVMIVESSTELQNTFRTQLKKYGYRVLVLSDATRALDRFQGDGPQAECVVFSSIGLGAKAVSAFNQFGDDGNTSSVPAILLLDNNHGVWRDKAKTDTHRVTMVMPIRMKQFRATLQRILDHCNQGTDLPS